MSSANGNPPCLGELASKGMARPAFKPGQPPGCDYAEATVWESLGGGWQSLFGCFCECGISVEWHDFACAEPRDWARTFHPDSVEICLNLSGHGRVTWGDQSALFGRLTAGFYAASADGISAWRLPGERHQFLTIEYSRHFLEENLGSSMAALHPVGRWACDARDAGPRLSSIYRLTASLRANVDLLRQPPVVGPARKLWYQGKALELMAEFFFAQPGDVEPVQTRQKQVARERVEQVIQILSGNLAEPPTLEQLGRQVGCSPYHLSRSFSREMGMTIPQYLRQIRMERAAELLKSAKFNVTEVALEVGYSSLSHFSHAFCETMGCCPGLYPLGGPQPIRGAALLDSRVSSSKPATALLEIPEAAGLQRRPRSKPIITPKPKATPAVAAG
jgi:AraC family transcriptional regulator